MKKRVFLLVCTLWFSASAIEIPSEVKREIFNEIKDSFISSIIPESIEGGVEYRIEFDDHVIIFNDDMKMVYSSDQIENHMKFDYFLQEATSIMVDDVKVKNKSAEVFLSICEGTEITYRSRLLLSKNNDKWKIVTKIFYEMR